MLYKLDKSKAAFITRFNFIYLFTLLVTLLPGTCLRLVVDFDLETEDAIFTTDELIATQRRCYKKLLPVL